MTKSFEQISLSPDELVFAQRMLPHFLAGKSAEESAAAVIADDERLFSALLDRRHSYYVATPDECGASHSTATGTGDVIADELARRAYRELRA